MKQKYFFILLSLLYLFSAIVRLIGLDDVPPGLYWDEIAILVDVKMIAKTGLDMHSLDWWQSIFPSYGDYKLAPYIWITSLFIKLMGESDHVVRIASALAGIGTVVVSGFLLSKLINLSSKISSLDNKLIILSSTFVMANSVWSIMFSRVGFEGHLAQFLLSLSIFFLLHQKRSIYWLFLSMVLGALAVSTYFSVLIVYLTMFVLTQILFFTNRHNIEKVSQLFNHLMLSFISPMILFFILILPLILPARYESMTNFRLGTLSIFNNPEYVVTSQLIKQKFPDVLMVRIANSTKPLMIKEIISNIFEHLNLNYIFVKSDPNLRHGTGQHGLFLLIFLPTFVISLYSFPKKYLKVFIFLISWWIISLLPASIPLNTPHALRSVNALMPLTLIIGYGLFVYVKWILDLPKSKKFIIGFISFSIFFFSQFQFLFYYFYVYPVVSSDEWLSGYKEAAQSYHQMSDEIKGFYWNVGDDKFFLWLINYYPGDINSMQQLPEINYYKDVSSFPRFYSQPFVSSEQLTVGDRFLIATNQYSLKLIEEMPDIRVLDKTPISRNKSIQLITIERKL